MIIKTVLTIADISHFRKINTTIFHFTKNYISLIRTYIYYYDQLSYYKHRNEIIPVKQILPQGRYNEG